MPNHHKKFRTFFKLINLGLLVVVALGCVKAEVTESCIKEGRRYGITKGLFQGRWYHYYERGLSFAEGHCWGKAERDLREALKQRDDGDRRRARTYGMHFIDYFPHRELGIVLFNQNRYADAIRELEASLNTAVTAKAEFYLDQGRKALILSQTSD
jgi:hypothetical protein